MVTLENKEDDVLVRRAAAIGLGRSRAPDAVEYLLAISDDKTEDMRVRQSAVVALALSEDARGERRVFAALEDDAPSIVIAGAVALPCIKNPDALGALLKALKHENSLVRLLAAESLGQRKEVRAVEPLKMASNDDVNDVAQAARKAIARIQSVPWYELPRLGSALDIGSARTAILGP